MEATFSPGFGFTISRTRYFLLILGICYLLFNTIVHGLRWTTESLSFLSTGGFDFMNVLIIVSNCFIYLTFFQYFSFYSLAVLKWLSYILLMLEIANQTLPYVLPEPGRTVDSIHTVSISCIMILWPILILRCVKNDFLAAKTLKTYAWSIIVASALSLLFLLVILFLHVQVYSNTFLLFFSLPYFVLLRFAGYLREKRPAFQSQAYTISDEQDKQ